MITVEAIMALRPCPDYDEERLRGLVGDGLDPSSPEALEVLLSLSQPDARWVVARLLGRKNSVCWAQACARRAKEYAAAAADYAASADYYAAKAADYDDYAATYAATYADNAADYAASAADYDKAAEHRKAMVHALELISNEAEYRGDR